MMAEWLITGGAIVLLLVVSAYFSASETAMTASSGARMHELARHGDTRAQVVIALYERKPRMIGAISNSSVRAYASTCLRSLRSRWAKVGDSVCMRLSDPYEV